nr:helix-turn-helix domain-containing protein [uncultured Sphingomonas sp.]
MDIGAGAKRCRELAELSQRKLAELVGTSEDTILRLERGEGSTRMLEAVLSRLHFRVEGMERADTFGGRVRFARSEKGLSAAKVAREAGVTTKALRSLELGHSQVRVLERVISVVAPNAKFIPQPPPLWSGKAFRTVANGTSKRERHPSDYYSTPYPITRLLLDVEAFPDHILEPAVGEARAIEAVLLERGHRVTSFDINGRGEEQRCFFDVDERYPAIITNPPFRLATEFIEHAKRIADEKIAMLLPLNNLTGFDRYQRLWNDTLFPLARVYVLNRGVNFLQDPTLERLGPSQMYSAWMIFERAHVGSPTIHWLNNQALMARRSS